jgi:hypothetical protein
MIWTAGSRVHVRSHDVRFCPFRRAFLSLYGDKPETADEIEDLECHISTPTSTTSAGRVLMRPR